MLNIGGENAGDAFYRYKMPKLVARVRTINTGALIFQSNWHILNFQHCLQIEGRGNGIKTNIVNNVDIAKALERPPECTVCFFAFSLNKPPFSRRRRLTQLFTADVLKFFGFELGAQTKFDKKSGTCIVNGAHEAARLSELLEIFIKKFVQCYSCGNPETVVKIKRENILLKCKACGFVSEVDPRLRLNGFIIKNPPEDTMSKAEKKVKKAEKERMKGLEGSGVDVGDEKKEKKEKKKKKSNSSSSKKKDGDDEEENETNGGGGGDEDEDEEEEEEDDVVWMTDTSESAMKKRAAEQLSAATAALVTQGNVEAEREAAKKREEKRRAEEEAAAKAKAEETARLIEEAAALKLSDPAAALKGMLARGASAEEIAGEVKSVEGGPAARMNALFTALFGDLSENERVAVALKEKKAFLLPHAGDPASQLAQLVAVESLLGVTLKGRAREAPLVLKVLYDADLAEEDLILAWFKKVDAAAVLDVPEEAAQAVRTAAQPFVEWLEDDDSEDDSEDEE